MEPTESLAYYIADNRYLIPEWDGYFSETNWLRNGLPDLEQSAPQLTIDGGAFTTVENIKGEYSEITFVSVSLWYAKPAHSKDEYEAAMAISKDIMAVVHDQITPEGIRIQGQGRNAINETEAGLGRIRMSFRLTEVT